MRVLFSSTSGDGHILPLLPLASAFAARGHDVVVAVSETQRPRVEAAGLSVAPAGPGLPELAERIAQIQAVVANLPASDRRTALVQARFGELEAALRLEPLQRLMRDLRPDLVVFESLDFAAPLAAAAAGVPSVNHSFGRAVPADVVRAAAVAVAPLWEGAGLRPDPLAGAVRGAYVDICPPVLAAPLAGTPALHVRLRPADAPPPSGQLRGRPLVYVTLGTIFNRVESFRMLLAAFAPLPVDVRMTVGANRDPSELEPIPANASVEPYVPQAEILPGCDVVVAHGGSGSTLAALAHGRPLVLVPHGADQFANAAACEAAGVAVVIQQEELTADSARAALATVLADASFADAARAVAHEIAAMPGADEAAATLEAWVPTFVD